MDQQPKIPTLKDAQKPQVKIKGMGAGLTLFDRLKQFKKKDLAFILAGLGTLFMAPLAEHFMMAPENGDASLQQGWGKGGTSGSFFGSGSSPYESGSHMASGGAIGGSGDIITPLNVRDPSSLVMGPGGTQQPPAGSAAPSAPPPTAPSRSDEDYKDALKGAASRAASAAVKKAPLPVPKVALGGSGLRGLGVAAGGSSASSGGSLPVGPAAGSVGGGGGSGLRLVRNTPGFKGVAGSRSPTGGTGLDNTKKAGANAGDAFNRAGSAAAGLNAAANETIPTGGQGFGGGGHGGAGANDKPGSGTGPGGSKSVGESLAFLRAKQRQEEELKLEFEKRKLKDPELLLYGIRNDILKASAGKIGEGLTSWGMCKGLGMGCPAPDSDYMCMGIPTKSSDIPMCSENAGKDGDKAKTSACYWPQVDGSLTSNKDGTGAKCIPSGKKGEGDKKPSTEEVANTGPGRLGESGAATIGGLNGVCTQIDLLLENGTMVNLGDNYLKGLRKSATQLVVFRDSMVGKTEDCSTARPANKADLDDLAKPVADTQTEALVSADDLIKTMLEDVNDDEVGNYQDKLLTDNNGPTMLAKGSREALTKIEKYVSDNALAAPPVFLAQPVDLVSNEENKKKVEDIEKTLRDSQVVLKGFFEKVQVAQDKLDGQGDGPTADTGSNRPILKELGEIAVDPGSLLKVQEANVPYEDKKSDIEAATEGVTIDNEPIEKAAQPIAAAAAQAKTKVGLVPEDVPDEKITNEDGSEVENPEYTRYKEVAKNARQAVQSVRSAQAGWLVTVQNGLTTAKSSLTGAPTR